MKTLLLIPLLLLTVGFVQSIDQHATATVRLNKSFFQLASGKAKSVIDGLVPELVIPPINITTPNIIFYTRSINLTHFDFPITTFSISKDGLTWNTVGGKIEIKMGFYVRWITPVGIKFSKGGIATVTVEDLRTNLNALIKTQDSRPKIIVNQCTANVDKLNIVFDAQITGWVLNKISPIVLGIIRNYVNENACILVASLAKKGNDFVSKQPEEIHIWRNIYVNYTATKDPIYHNDYVEAECSFRVAVRDNSASDLADDLFASAVLDTLKMNDHVLITPVTAPRTRFHGSILSVLQGVVVALAAYTVFGIIRSLLMRIRRRPTHLIPFPQGKAYENKGLAA